MGSRLNFSQGLDFEGSVAINGNPKVFLDGGATIEEVIVNTNLAASEFSLIIEVEGDRRVKITGTEMLAREAYEQRTATADQFVFSFADALARTNVGEAMTSLTTQPGQRIEIALEIGGVIVAASPYATLYTETSPNRGEEYRLYVLPENVPVTKVGENYFAGFRRGVRPNAYALRRVFAYGAITHLSIEQDDKFVFGKRELLKVVNDGRLLRNGKVVPAGCYVFDPVLKGNVIKDLFDTYSRKALRFTFTTSDSADIKAVTEYVQDMRLRAA